MRTFQMVFNGTTVDEVKQKRDAWLAEQSQDLNIPNPQGKMTYVITLACSVKGDQTTVTTENPKPTDKWVSGCGGCTPDTKINK